MWNFPKYRIVQITNKNNQTTYRVEKLIKILGILPIFWDSEISPDITNEFFEYHKARQFMQDQIRKEIQIWRNNTTKRVVIHNSKKSEYLNLLS